MTLLSVSMIYSSSIEAESNKTLHFFVTTPEDVIEACEEALDKCSYHIGSLEDIIDAQDKALDAAAKREARLIAQRDSIFRNPYLWGIAGFAIGSLVTVQILK
jgi:hypothetical protein